MLMPSIFGENLFDDFFDDFARPYKVAYAQPTCLMKTDIKDLETAYELDIDIPGVKKEDVKAELKDGYLTIHASTKKEDESKKEKYVRKERFYGSSSRSFFVGKNVKQEDIKAKFENGVLRVIVPKEENNPKVEESKYIAIEGE